MSEKVSKYNIAMRVNGITYYHPSPATFKATVANKEIAMKFNAAQEMQKVGEEMRKNKMSLDQQMQNQGNPQIAEDEW